MVREGDVIDGYATHQEALVTAALETSGPILELGCGEYSTPLLSAIARRFERDFLIQASNPDWLARFAGMGRTELVRWSRWTPPSGRWGLVFLDSEERTIDRVKRLAALSSVADVVVMHDANVQEATAEWGTARAAFGRVRWFRRLLPATVILEAGRC